MTAMIITTSILLAAFVCFCIYTIRRKLKMTDKEIHLFWQEKIIKGGNK